jgi:hypothetical protein
MERGDIVEAIRESIWERKQKQRPISEESRFFADLKIWGDDFEELVEDLAKKLNFDEKMFYERFNELGYRYPGEFDPRWLPKLFFIDILGLLRGRVVYRLPPKKGEDITVGQMAALISELKGK